MSFDVRFTPDAEEDLQRLSEFLLGRDDWAPELAVQAIVKSLDFLRHSPFSCRKSRLAGHPRIRELVITFGRAGYVALFEIDDASTVTVAALRHQREDDFY